jgi:hypothetical protein
LVIRGRGESLPGMTWGDERKANFIEIDLDLDLFLVRGCRGADKWGLLFFVGETERRLVTRV